MIIGVLALAVTAGIFLLLAVALLIAERYLVNYGSCLVRINEGSVEFEQDGGGTLLAALYEHKVFIPSACGGKGSCGYCKVVVLEGGGPLLPTETPYINRSEVKAGVRLACQVKIKQPMELKLPEDLLNVREFKARVSLIRELTHDIKEVNLELIEPEEIKQRPGQYVQILAPGPDGPVFRAYSISSPAYEHNKVQLVVRLVPGGIASTYIHNLKEGDEVTFTGPFGEFRLSEDPSKAVICVGGGAGMAPISNIIHTIYQTWPDRPCWLFFGCRTTKDVFYLDKFKKLAEKHPNFKVIYGLSDPLEEEEQWEGDTGFIHLSVDKRLSVELARQAFLCGPPPMIEAVTEVLKEKGLRNEDIFYDKF
ncbi:MAG: 2Fe-2S iron-sulfur cluster binding domain-containing protein [Spirochaetaceae bacterium]|nr:MAG: 2Fe-2S iron-sulfur cluster binding domain-containing protein [Spirochaetaceae bacterium]